MSTHKNQEGAVNTILLLFILTATFLLVALGFGVWAYSSRQDYKDNVDKKIQKAVAVAVKKTQTEKDNEFIEKEKSPLREYKGAADIGSVSFQYPKTWSITQKDSEGELSLIGHPVLVNTNQDQIYALRVEVINQSYKDLSDEFETGVQKGTVKASPYALPKIPKVVGIRFDGQLTNQKNGTVILLPMRDKTIRISTENPDFRGDLDKIILPSFTYNP